MGGCCCCCCFASTTTQLIRSPPYYYYPESEEREPLSSHQTTGSVHSTGLLVDTNLDTSVLDTYRSPSAPIPYDTYGGHLPTPLGNRENALNKSEMSSHTTNQEYECGETILSKVKNLESGIEMATSKEVEGEESDELKKSTEPFIPSLDEEDCPICLEEYDTENPKLITKCDHDFHLACILEWMERSDSCPVCDQEMVLSPTIAG